MAEGRDQQEMQRRYQSMVSELDQVDQKLIRKVSERCVYLYWYIEDVHRVYDLVGKSMPALL